jgi:hypothetical protein
MLVPARLSPWLNGVRITAIEAQRDNTPTPKVAASNSLSRRASHGAREVVLDDIAQA